MELNLVSIRDVASKYPDVDRTDVLYAIKSGKLKATKVGWSWLIPVDSLPQKWEDLGIKRRRGVTK